MRVRPSRAGAFLAGLGFVFSGPLTSANGHSGPTVPAESSSAFALSPTHAEPPSPLAFAPALSPSQDVLLLPGDNRPTPTPTIVGATMAPGVSPAAIGAVLLDPKSLQDALPSLVRADVIQTRPHSSPRRSTQSIPDRLLSWEIEIPFFNLTGKAWLKHDDNVIELSLIEGAFAPGTIRFRPVWHAAWGATILSCESRVDFRSANWLIRRLSRHDPWAETAMAAAANWVLLRAVAMTAANHERGLPRSPRGAIGAPAPATITSASLMTPELAPLRAMGTVALVRLNSTGRLAFASVSKSIAPLDDTWRQLETTPEMWSAFPGWKLVQRKLIDGEERFEVKDDIAFVDLSATWRLLPEPPTRRRGAAQAIDGALTGAVLSWEIFDEDRRRAALSLSMHPRLDGAGIIPRRMIAYEPLLEHALALAMTYADFAATVDSLSRH